MNLASFPDSMVENGKLHGLISGYTTVDGVVHDLTDVWFQQGAQVALQLVSNGQSLDLATVDTARLHEVDRIDLTGVDIDTLTLSLQGMLEIGGQANCTGDKGWINLSGVQGCHQLVVDGDDADQVIIVAVVLQVPARLNTTASNRRPATVSPIPPSCWPTIR